MRTARQEYYQLLVIANTLVVGMMALAVALITGILLLETRWGEMESVFWSTYGEFVFIFFFFVCVRGLTTPKTCDTYPRDTLRALLLAGETKPSGTRRNQPID